MGATVQNEIGTVASLLEKARNLLVWTTPPITTLVVVAMCLASVALYLIPFRYLPMLWATKKMYKKGLQRYQPFGLGKLPKDHRPCNEVLELIGRVPDDLQIEQRKLLPPLAIKKQVGGWHGCPICVPGRAMTHSACLPRAPPSPTHPHQIEEMDKLRKSTARDSNSRRKSGKK